ncbi:hypothetical protein LTS18_011441, partial [Coniosporium uncinatum]
MQDLSGRVTELDPEVANVVPRGFSVSESMEVKRSAAKRELIYAAEEMAEIGIRKELNKVGKRTCDFAAKLSLQMLKELKRVGLWPIHAIPDEPRRGLALLSKMNFAFQDLASCDVNDSRSAPCTYQSKDVETWRAQKIREIRKGCHGICISCAREDDVPR